MGSARSWVWSFDSGEVSVWAGQVDEVWWLTFELRRCGVEK